jgi:HAD superfamily hydrolase (TIGR01490 family)
MKEVGRKLAIFDFDGTAIRGDSFIPYLLLVYILSLFWAPRRFLSISLQTPKVIKGVTHYLMGRLDPRSLKEILLSSCLRDMPLVHINRINGLFHKLFRFLVKKRILQALLELKGEGCTIVLLSASPDLYLKAFRDPFRFDFLISTRVEIIGDRVTGRIIGENCKGAEKVKRLQEIFTKEEIGNAISYADSKSDTSLMNIVGKPMWV